METTGSQRDNDIQNPFAQSLARSKSPAPQSGFSKGKVAVGGHVKRSLMQRICGSIRDRMLRAK